MNGNNGEVVELREKVKALRKEHGQMKRLFSMSIRSHVHDPETGEASWGHVKRRNEEIMVMKKKAGSRP